MIPSYEEDEYEVDVNVITKARAQKEDLVIPDETRPKKKRKLMSWRERKAKWLTKSQKG